MSTKAPATDKTLVDQATEWLSAPLPTVPSRVEFLLLLLMVGYFVWWVARSWGWNEGMADAARLRAQGRRDARDELLGRREHDRLRQQLREDVELGVRMALDRRDEAVPREEVPGFDG
jgi:hypothetical protein